MMDYNFHQETECTYFAIPWTAKVSRDQNSEIPKESKKLPICDGN